jgi:hemerythrin superfamily protein
MPTADRLHTDRPNPDPDGPDRPRDAVEILDADHRRLERLFTALCDGRVRPERRRDLVDVAVAELVRHMTAEEQYLYPALRRHVPDGDRLADRELAEHGPVEAALGDLLGTFVEEERFDPLVHRLADAVRRHVRAADDELFPALRRVVGPAALVDLGTAILSAKKLAPTRPHPASPRHPPFNKVAGPVLGLVDHAIDSLTDRPTTVDELG